MEDGAADAGGGLRTSFRPRDTPDPGLFFSTPDTHIFLIDFNLCLLNLWIPLIQIVHLNKGNASREGPATDFMLHCGTLTCPCEFHIGDSPRKVYGSNIHPSVEPFTVTYFVYNHCRKNSRINHYFILVEIQNFDPNDFLNVWDASTFLLNTPSKGTVASERLVYDLDLGYTMKYWNQSILCIFSSPCQAVFSCLPCWTVRYDR
jgi:hypothetical protein